MAKTSTAVGWEILPTSRDHIYGGNSPTDRAFTSWYFSKAMLVSAPS